MIKFSYYTVAEKIELDSNAWVNICDISCSYLCVYAREDVIDATFLSRTV